MRAIHEQEIALECLKLAATVSYTGSGPELPARVVERAEAYFAFVVGENRSSAAGAAPVKVG